MQNFTRLSWATGTSHGRIKPRFKHFQSLYQELLISKALLKLPFPTHGRSANLLTFCHSHMQHTEPTPAQCLRRVQKADKTLSQQKDKTDFNEMNLFLHSLSCICECSFLSWGFSVSLRLTLISFSSAARKNTACSRKKRKFIYITRPLKDFKTQLPAKWNQAQCGWATCGVLGIGKNESNSVVPKKRCSHLDLPLKQYFYLCVCLLFWFKIMDMHTEL